MPFPSLPSLPLDYVPYKYFQKSQKLSALAISFVQTAKKCSKIIISERHLPNHFKTIPTVDFGGLAGGVKYVHHGILFKVAHDEQLRIYSKNIENAQKAAAHDLRYEKKGMVISMFWT